jgi:hypothetical protein
MKTKFVVGYKTVMKLSFDPPIGTVLKCVYPSGAEIIVQEHKGKQLYAVMITKAPTPVLYNFREQDCAK